MTPRGDPISPEIVINFAGPSSRRYAMGFRVEFSGWMPTALIDRTSMAVVHYEGLFRNIVNRSEAPLKKNDITTSFSLDGAISEM